MSDDDPPRPSMESRLLVEPFDVPVRRPDEMPATMGEHLFGACARHTETVRCSRSGPRTPLKRMFEDERDSVLVSQGQIDLATDAFLRLADAYRRTEQRQPLFDDMVREDPRGRHPVADRQVPLAMATDDGRRLTRDFVQYSHRVVSNACRNEFRETGSDARRNVVVEDIDERADIQPTPSVGLSGPETFAEALEAIRAGVQGPPPEPPAELAQDLRQVPSSTSDEERRVKVGFWYLTMLRRHWSSEAPRYMDSGEGRVALALALDDALHSVVENEMMHPITALVVRESPDEPWHGLGDFVVRVAAGESRRPNANEGQVNLAASLRLNGFTEDREVNAARNRCAVLVRRITDEIQRTMRHGLGDRS